MGFPYRQVSFDVAHLLASSIYSLLLMWPSYGLPLLMGFF